MEHSSIIILVLVVAFIVFRYYFKTSIKPKIKGKAGELMVSSLLRRLDRNQYKIINNLYLRSRYGSTQIDHLIISVYGIFVIETKNYNGWIHGSENSQFWKQTFYNTKKQFLNPIRQNNSHIKFLKGIMENFRWVPYHSIVVFTGQGELRNIYASTPVIYKKQLIKTIKQYDTPKLSFDQMDKYLMQLSPYITNDKGAKKIHSQNVKRYTTETKRNIRNNICPNCKGKLILKSGKYGKFYGCSNFPRCNFTKNY